MIISLSLQAIEQVRSLWPELPTGYLSSVSLGSLSRLPVTALALSRQRSTAPVIREAHARGLEVYVWTVNDAGGMIEMIGRGADGIITDDRDRRSAGSATSCGRSPRPNLSSCGSATHSPTKKPKTRAPGSSDPEITKKQKPRITRRRRWSLLALRVVTNQR